MHSFWKRTCCCCCCCCCCIEKAILSTVLAPSCSFSVLMVVIEQLWLKAELEIVALDVEVVEKQGGEKVK
jgi:hypothetical protein